MPRLELLNFWAVAFTLEGTTTISGLASDCEVAGCEIACCQGQPALRPNLGLVSAQWHSPCALSLLLAVCPAHLFCLKAFPVANEAVDSSWSVLLFARPAAYKFLERKRQELAVLAKSFDIQCLHPLNLPQEQPWVLSVKFRAASQNAGISTTFLPGGNLFAGACAS